MSDSVVREFYSSLGRGDIPAVLSLLAPDISWRLYGPGSVPYFGDFRGISGVEKFFKLLDSAEQAELFEATELIGGIDGNHVFVRGHERSTCRKTGRAFSSEWIHIFEVVEGRITSFEEFIDSAAVEAAYR